MIGIRSEARRGRLLPGLALLFCSLGCSEGAGDADGLGGAQGAVGPAACSLTEGLFAEAVGDHAFGAGQDVGQDQFPELVLGPPRGAGETAGSTDQVVSLGEGGFVELSFGDHGIVDAAGPDFIVFENAFFAGGDPEDPYAELGEVSVSQDGSDWVVFPCTSRQYPYGSCAGWHPVLANAESNDVDPTDADLAGGDAFDLADVDLAWVRYVRIDDVVDEDQLAFDLDAVAVVHPGCFE